MLREVKNLGKITQAMKPVSNTLEVGTQGHW